MGSATCSSGSARASLSGGLRPGRAGAGFFHNPAAAASLAADLRTSQPMALELTEHLNSALYTMVISEYFDRKPKLLNIGYNYSCKVETIVSLLGQAGSG